MKVKKIVLVIQKPVIVSVDHKSLKLNPQDVVELPVDVAGNLVRGGYAEHQTPSLKRRGAVRKEA